MAKQRLCYDCGRKLYQNKIHTTLISIDNLELMFTFHKQCAERILKEEPSKWRKMDYGNH